jgi:uncharacterized membrane protein
MRCERQLRKNGSLVAGNKPPARQVRAAVQTHQQTVSVLRQGPIPSPQELLEYNQLLPGAADRIIAMAEREQSHRLNLEDLATRADIRHRDDVAGGQLEATRGVFRSDMAGQFLGGLVAVLCVIGAVYTAKLGAHPTVSIALVSLPIAAIIKALRAIGSKPPKAKP